MKSLNIYGRTDTGRVRKNNEDIFYINERGGYCLVADGIGGAAGGELASTLFAETVKKCLSAQSPISTQKASGLIKQSFQAANTLILDYANKNTSCKGMGCTAELVLFTENHFVLGHMGDSKTFRLRDGILKQLTRDHSLVQEQLDQGLITLEEAKNHALSNIIVRAVGIEPEPSLDILSGKLLPGDTFLLCTDGLTDKVEPGLIKNHLSTYARNQEKVSRLIQEANMRGGHDNITVVIAEIS